MILGMIGIFLPVMPTAPFVLLAAYFFSRSSKRLHQHLINHPRFGHIIDEWERYRVIRRPAKWAATIGVGFTILSSFLFVKYLILRISVIVIALAVLIYIWSRPDQAPR